VVPSEDIPLQPPRRKNRCKGWCRGSSCKSRIGASESLCSKGAKKPLAECQGASHLCERCWAIEWRKADGFTRRRMQYERLPSVRDPERTDHDPRLMDHLPQGYCQLCQHVCGIHRNATDGLCIAKHPLERR
jgi:hypothetical protein